MCFKFWDNASQFQSWCLCVRAYVCVQNWGGKAASKTLLWKMPKHWATYLYGKDLCVWMKPVSFINTKHREASLLLPCFWTFVRIKQFPSPWLLNFPCSEIHKYSELARQWWKERVCWTRLHFSWTLWNIRMYGTWVITFCWKLLWPLQSRSNSSQAVLLHTRVHDSKRAKPREAKAYSYFFLAICYTLLFFDTLCFTWQY